MLAVGAGAPATIRVTLREALECVRAYPDDELPSDGLGKGRRAALDAVAQHFRASWREATGSGPGKDDLCQLLNLLHVESIDVGEDERDEQVAKGILRVSVLDTPDQAAAAWSVLITAVLHLIRTHGHAGSGHVA